MSISAYGNKQVNIRFESDLLEEIKTAAKTDGIGLQDWVRNACRSALGQSVPGAVGKSEFEATIAKLTDQIESAKGLGGTNQFPLLSPDIEQLIKDQVNVAIATIKTPEPVKPDLQQLAWEVVDLLTEDQKKQ
jgi:hypothetical protein